MIVFNLANAACWLAFLVAWAAFAVHFGRSGRSSRAPFAIVYRLVLVATVFLTVQLAGRLSGELFGRYTLAIGALGTLLSVAGVAFAIWARIALGRNWGMPMTIHSSPELVTAGPYRLVRHPIYTGVIVMLIGTLLIYPLAVLPCIVAISYMMISAFREERDMALRFPEAYPEYCKHSKMLLPFLI